MKNWSGNQEWKPKKVLKPKTEIEVIEIVKNAINNNFKIRTIGTGHSFTALCKTDEILINLDEFQGISDCDLDGKLVTVKAGTKLHRLSEELHNVGLAMENLGDVDVQSIAGAISTGTHGTGIKLGNISTQVREITFVNGKGNLITCSETENKELFKCMQISLGAFGIITRVKLKCVSVYKLELKKIKNSINEVLENFNNYNEQNRNFEFYWLPYTKVVQSKISNLSENKEDKENFINYINDIILENYAFKGFCETAKMFPSLNQGVSKISSKFISNSKKVQYSHKIYSTPRLVKFNEMEYNVPYEAYQEVLKDVINCINKNNFKIHFPLENRFVKEDDIFLSPAYQRKSAYIACHVYKGKSYKKYFNALEEIFCAYGGRPHWGKLHTKNYDYLKKTYPHLEVFKNLRQANDPDGLFINNHLKELFNL